MPKCEEDKNRAIAEFFTMLTNMLKQVKPLLDKVVTEAAKKESR
jgi:hypothetical protein